MATVDTRELERFASNLERVDMGPVLIQAVEEISMRLLRKVKIKTPVDTGELRQSWFVTSIVKRGSYYETEVVSDATYATYVEYGHRTRGGASWVPGRFMLTISVEEVEGQMEAIVQRKVREVWEGLFR